MDVNRDNLFPIEVFRITINNSIEVNKTILEQLYASAEYKRYHTKYKNTSRYQNINISLTNVPMVQYVLMRATSIIQVLTKQTYQISPDNWWFNIMQAGDSINVHSHSPGPVWSGVYYIKVPKGSGKLYFTNSRTHIKESKVTKTVKTFYYKYIGHNFEDIPYKPEEGMMLLYPSWLDHKVSMHQVPSERIALSFNLKYPFSIL